LLYRRITLIAKYPQLHQSLFKSGSSKYIIHCWLPCTFKSASSLVNHLCVFSVDLVLISKFGIAPCIFSFCITFVFDRFGNCFTRCQVSVICSLFCFGFTQEFMFKYPITDLISLTFLLEDICTAHSNIHSMSPF